MKLFDCKVRLSGSVANEVRKHGVTAAEIEILRVLHGGDAVGEIEEKGDMERTASDERDRLEAIYLATGNEDHVKRVNAVLGPRHFDFSSDPVPAAAPKAPARASRTA